MALRKSDNTNFFKSNGQSRNLNIYDGGLPTWYSEYNQLYLAWRLAAHLGDVVLRAAAALRAAPRPPRPLTVLIAALPPPRAVVYMNT